jgi:hypothetical protein
MAAAKTGFQSTHTVSRSLKSRKNIDNFAIGKNQNPSAFSRIRKSGVDLKRNNTVGQFSQWRMKRFCGKSRSIAKNDLTIKQGSRGANLQP